MVSCLVFVREVCETVSSLGKLGSAVRDKDRRLDKTTNQNQSRKESAVIREEQQWFAKARSSHLDLNRSDMV